jgi:hypothetical protein
LPFRARPGKGDHFSGRFLRASTEQIFKARTSKCRGEKENTKSKGEDKKEKEEEEKGKEKQLEVEKEKEKEKDSDKAKAKAKARTVWPMSLPHVFMSYLTLSCLASLPCLAWSRLVLT